MRHFNIKAHWNTAGRNPIARTVQQAQRVYMSDALLSDLKIRADDEVHLCELLSYR